jgi:cell division protein FtsL
MAKAVSTIPRSRPATRPATRTVKPRSAEARRAAKSPVARVVTRRDATNGMRRVIMVSASIAVLAIMVMFLVVAFQTRIAETQMKIDKINSQIQAERDRYDALRLERSALRDPARRVVEATAMGMIPGTGTDFTTVEPTSVAAVLVSTGGVEPEYMSDSEDPLENYGAVKALIGGQP